MPTKEVRLDLNINDGGTAHKTEGAVQELEEKLQAIKIIAKQTKAELKSLMTSTTGAKAQGGTAGSRAAAGGGSGGNTAADFSKELSIYSRSRGVGALTGAEGRDFSAQAQGLGGIVRLYATYAANVFAVGMAFRSLSDAMDTTNMVKGLDQLGAAQGKNLGQLSKRVAELSGGAISMREAMQAVAQTSSGGMSGKNIERLAGVARSASAALGVAMPDAISRLSRGITKLEPELLDELGIMTRLEPAVQAYARELGKAASQLTDFERRQAFANAVLKEGEAKFGDIADIATNPYDRLLSSLKDVLQVGASVTNTVLAPLAEVLAASPNALGLGIAALAAIIAKQAIPAIGQLRQGLADAAKQAAAVASMKTLDAADATRAAIGGLSDSDVADVISRAEAMAEAQIDIVVDAEKKILELRKRGFREGTASFNLLNSAALELTDKDFEEVEARAQRFEDKGRKREASLLRDISNARKKQIEAEVELRTARDANIEVLKKEQVLSKGGIQGLTQKLAIEAQTSAVKKALVANAAYNASIIGWSGAHTILNKEIAKSGIALTAFQTVVLKTQASVAMLAGIVGTLATALIKLTNLFAYIAIVVTVFTVLDSLFSSNAKEAKAFDAALEDLTSSAENFSRTMEHLDKNLSGDTMAGINATANSLDNLTNSLVTFVDSAEKNLAAIASGGFWSAFWDNVSKATNSDVESKLAKNMADTITKALDALANSGLSNQAADKFKKILGVTSLDTSSLEKAIKRSSSVIRNDLVSALSEANLALSNSNSRIQSFKTATEASSRAYAQFIQATSNTSPLFRVGATLQSLAVSMHDIAGAGATSAKEITAIITELANTPDTSIVFGASFIKQFGEVREEFIAQENIIAEYKKSLKDLDRQIAKTAETLPVNYDAELDPADIIKSLATQQVAAIKSIRQLSKDRKGIEEAITVISSTQADRSRMLFVKGMADGFAKGAELMRISLGQAAEKGALAISKATLAGLSGARKADVENSIAKKELEIQLRAIDTNIDLIAAQELSRAAMDKLTTTLALSAGIAGGKGGDELNLLEEAQKSAAIYYDLIEAGKVASKDNIISAGYGAAGQNIIDSVTKKGVGFSQRSAEQQESKIFVQAQLQAQGISSDINKKTGELEDTQKLLGLSAQLTQSELARKAIISQILGVTSALVVSQQAQLNTEILLNKHASELSTINTTIAISQSSSEKALQEEYKLSILARHEQELSTLNLQNAQNMLTVRAEMFARELELVTAINTQQYTSGTARLDVLTAEAQAASQLYSISENYLATQTYLVGVQKTQLDYVKAIGEAQNAFAQKEMKAQSQIAALDPNSGAAEIKEISDELKRQEGLTKTAVTNAKTALSTQQKILEVNKKAATQQAIYNRLISNSNEIAVNMAAGFGEVGEAVGGVVEAFSRLIVNTDKGIAAMEELFNKKKQFEGDSEATAKIDADIAIERQKNLQNEVSSYGRLAGASKQFFDERSAGYEALAALEKTMFVIHAALTLKQIAMDVMATGASLLGNETRAAGNVAEAESDASKGIIKTIASLPFPANVAAGAAIAAVFAALLSSMGGSAPSVPSMPGGVSAEDVQSTQGTGRKYVNGVLKDNNYGALGSTDQATDISDSLQLIENNTSITSSFGQKTLNALKAIQNNTKELAASVFRTTDVGKLTSGFGTVEKAPTAPSTGLLAGLIPSSSKSVEIVDKGIKVIGTFTEVLAGAAQYLEYETIKSTKTKSGFLGIGGGTKVKISTNTKDLDQQAQEVIIGLFTSLADTAIGASKAILGGANNDIQNILDTFVVKFKTSGLGLSGDDFAEAILSESSVIMNEIVGTALPALDEFRQLGEGFTSTLIRIATTMDVVNEKARLQGISIEGILARLPKVTEATQIALEGALAGYDAALLAAVNTTNKIKVNGKSVLSPSAQEVANLQAAEQRLLETRRMIVDDMGSMAIPYIDAINAAQAVYTAAELAIIDNVNAQKDFITVSKLLSGELKISGDAQVDASNGIRREIKELYEASLSLSSAVDLANSALNDQMLLNIRFYDALVTQMGGLELFIEKTDFFFENFFTETEQMDAKTKEVILRLSELSAEGVLSAEQLRILTDGIGNARLEYRELVFAQDVTTEAGRAAYAALVTLAPAIVDVTKGFEDAVDNIDNTIEDLVKTITDRANELNIGVDTFSSLLNDAVLGRLEAEKIGETVADIIKEGFYTAVSQTFVDDITNSIVQQLIVPVLTGVVNWTAVGAVAAAAAVDGIVNSMIEKAELLAMMLNNPTFKLALNTLSAAITKVVTSINTSIKSIDYTFSSIKVTEYLEEINDLVKQLEERRLTDIIEAEQERLDLLQEQASLLESSSQTFRDFSNSLQDFKTSLLVGPESPLTPIDQYAAISAELNSLYETALNSTNAEEKSLALSRIQEVATEFLNASRLVYSSGDQYTADFNYVQAILDSLISSTGTLATVDEQQLAALNAQIAASEQIISEAQAQLDTLNNIDDSIEGIQARLDELYELLAAEYEVGKLQVVEGFTTLDKNFDGLLTFEELQASGIASDDTIRAYISAYDTNSDQQISRLEALNASSADTLYTIQSIVPILDGINLGIINVNTGLAAIAAINQANIAAGGGAVSGTYVPPGNVGAGYSGSSVNYNSPLGGSVQNGMVYGINGQSLTLETAKAQILDFKSQVEQGLKPAKELYDIFMSWGADSNMVAGIIGTSQQDVLSWFKAMDPSIPSFAQGINYLPRDMLVEAHEGERIMPKADNAELMQNLQNRNNSNNELLVEIRKLNQKIAALEKTVAEGAMINAEATERNTKEISKTVKETNSIAAHTESIRKRAVH